LVGVAETERSLAERVEALRLEEAKLLESVGQLVLDHATALEEVEGLRLQVRV
jgi:hypothetical protein